MNCNANNTKKFIRESPAQFESRIKPRVYVKRITRRTMYQKDPYFYPKNAKGKRVSLAYEFSPSKTLLSDYPKSLTKHFYKYVLHDWQPVLMLNSKSRALCCLDKPQGK